MMSCLKFKYPDVDDFTADLQGFKLTTSQKKLVMTLLVRNEKDIIRHNIDFHLSKGVDFIIATDNDSTDGTREILAEYEKRGILHVIDEKGKDHDQAGWNNHMTTIARDKYNADIVFHCDADEFWHPRAGNLKYEILKRPEDILIVDVVNILLSDKSGKETFPEDAKYAVVDPLVAEDYINDTKDTNFFYFKYPPKVIFKLKNKLFFVSQGNHFVTNKDSSVAEGISKDILIYHYPIRNKAQFFQKTIQSGSSHERNKKLDKKMGFHVRRWYKSYKKGLLDKEYKKLILKDTEVNEFLKQGFVEEIDFRDLMSGFEATSGVWKYFNRKFEYEEMLHDFESAWSGHKYFAYDLVRNLKPKTIVELGTYKGISFCSFCQGVKDARYNANLYSVDTWLGDKHSGFYDSNIFETLTKIVKRYYCDLKINFLEKTFDQACNEFEDYSIDLLHIDGLHTYEAVKHDFETWLPKVKKEGIIFLHDIFVNKDDFGVYKLWEELKNKYKTIEFYQSYGLGVIFKNECGYDDFFAKEKEWQMRYSCIAEDKRNKLIHEMINGGDDVFSPHSKKKIYFCNAVIRLFKYLFRGEFHNIGQAVFRFIKKLNKKF